MCGIFGMVSSRREVDQGELAAARDLLYHRGPDAAGLWVDERRQVGLAHRRLSIIDLSDAGHQPMANEEGTIQLVYNGEIYNFQDLRAALEQKGHRFRSRCDSEVIVHAYEEWGQECVNRFNGMFAFALYDRRTDQLFLARDRFGEKPLYYYHHDGTFVFSSELKAIIKYPGLSLNLDCDYLYQYLIFGYVPHPATMFKNTYKLPPAHRAILRVADQSIAIEKYWDNMDAVAEATGIRPDMDHAIDELEETLADAVSSRLVADVPVGAFLSGGVDSSLVAGMIARVRPGLKTFSIGFWEDAYDEAPYAKKIAQHLGCEHHELYVTPEQALAAIKILPDIYDEPFADSSGVPTFLVSQFAKEHVKVALTGDGADELFGGYDTYPRLAVASCLLRVPASVRQALGRVLSWGGAGKMKRHAALLRQDEAWQLYLYLNERTIAKKTDVEQILPWADTGSLAASNFALAFQGAMGLGNVQAAMIADSKTYMVDDNLAKVDRASMAVSLECRVPFLDHRVAERSMGFTEREKMGLWRMDRKRLLRTVLARYVPRSYFERPKRGFSIPLAQWFRGDLRCLLDEYLDRDRLHEEGLFDADFVQQITREHADGRRDREAILWALVFWEMWREKWGV